MDYISLIPHINYHLVFLESILLEKIEITTLDKHLYPITYYLNILYLHFEKVSIKKTETY